jgi:predicted Zn finger-like uncharacterized protein
MKITCQACAAKYTIADDKVLGKVVKIRCKKCSANIVINGIDGTGEAEGTGDAPRAPWTETWTVNVADGDQRPMTDAEVGAAYRAGTIDDETLCWKDGMPEWLAIREIPRLVRACAGADDGSRGAEPHTSANGGNATHGLDDDEEGVPSAAAGGASAVSAARRAGGRNPPAADLFGGAAHAGGEDDVMTSAPSGVPQLHNDPHRLTGARNENSVLFSLNALTGKPGVPGMPDRPMPASSEASGLIDIRQLSAQIGIGDEKKKSRVDDIMNLAGGMTFSPTLTAPALSAPAVQEYAAQPSERVSIGPPAKSKAFLFLALGAGAFLIMAAVGVAFAFMHREPSSAEATRKTEPSAAASENAERAAAPETSASPPAAASSSAAAAAPPETASAHAAPAPDTASATAAIPSSAAAAATGGGVPSAGQEGTTPAGEEAKTAAAKPKAATPPGVATPAAPASDQPFNMGEAKARLAAIAAGVQSCKRGDAVGTGRVVVLFSPSGGAQTATVNGPPFEGTPTGACVAARFRGARVPPFSGSPFSVIKSFTIN